MKILLFFVLLLCGYPCAIAQRVVKYDSAKISVRSVNKEALDKLKNDREFQYESIDEPVKSIWERLWSWIWYKIDQIMSTRNGEVTVWSVVILIAVAIIFFFALNVSGMNRQSLLARRTSAGLAYSVLSDDIHGISFDGAIQEATRVGNFRLALRLLYLQSLKLLSDGGYIEWQINKTNSDYISEVLNKPWYLLFNDLTRKFESSWYGEKNIDKNEFDGLQVQFQQFNNQLK